MWFIDPGVTIKRVLLALAVLLLQSASYAQSILHFHKGRQKLGELIDSINKQTNDGININWPTNKLDLDKEVWVPESASLNEILDTIASQLGRECHWTRSDVRFTQITAPRRAERIDPLPPEPILYCRIKVVDEDNVPLQGATIGIGNPILNKATDTGGNVAITVKGPGSALVTTTSYVGMTTCIDTVFPGLERTIMLKRLPVTYTTGYVYSTPGIYVPQDRSDARDYQLNATSNSTPQTILEGQIPGLLVTQTNGNSTALSTLTIHGQNSLFNSIEPLYIVDNVVLAAQNASMSNLATNISAGSQSPFSYFSLGDIEHIEVLKDAEATAIYGSRGANGVIIITTKRAKMGRPHLDVQLSTGITHISDNLHLMNTNEYLAMRTEAFTNDNIAMDSAHAGDVRTWGNKRNTDWRKFIMGSNGRTSEGRMAITGGTTALNYRIGAVHTTETSVYQTNPMHERTNTSFNIDHQSGNGKLDIQISGLFAWDKNHQFAGDDLAKLQFLAPNAPATTRQGQQLITPYENVHFINPWYLIYQPAVSTAHNYLADAFLTWRFSRSLTFRSNLGWNETMATEKASTPAWIQDPIIFSNPVDYNYAAHTVLSSKIVEPQLEYKKAGPVLIWSALLGSSLQKLSSSPGTDYNYKAGFGRFTAMLDSTYIFNLSCRKEGSDRLSAKMHYGTFASVGAEWILSNARFMDSIHFVNLARLRASYGVTGNDEIGNAYFSSTDRVGASMFSGMPLWESPAGSSSPQTWERNTKLELAMDASMVNNRLMVTVAWYRNRSTNQLIPTAVPQGGSSITFQNWPTLLVNQGFDFSVVSKNIWNRDFRWLTTFNWSFPTTRLIAFDDLSGTIFNKALSVGSPLGSQLLYHYLGVDKTTGLYQVADRNGDGKLTDADKTLKQAQAITSFGGLDNLFRYKDFALEILIDARVGIGNSYLADLYLFNAPGKDESQYSNTVTAFNDRWSGTNNNGRYQKVTTGLLSSPEVEKAINNYRHSDAVLANTSIFRLRKTQFSYNFSPRVLARMHLMELSLFLVAQNLFTISPGKGPSPELQNVTVMPILKTIETGIRLNI